MKIFAFRPFKQWAGILPLLLPVLAPAAVNFFDPTTDAPDSLSKVRIYTNIVTKVTDTALKYYDVNSALWSDAAHKDRWIILPPGRHLTYVDTTDKFDFPENTIFVKLFRHDTVTGDSASRIYWETRLLVKKSGNPDREWYGFSYKWNKAGTEAVLVSQELGLDTVMFLASAPYYRKWHFPSAGDCERCHRVAPIGRGVLGFFPAQLKRQSAANPAINQVTALYNAGVFSNAPTAAEMTHRWRGMNEGVPTGLSPSERIKVIDTMARSYIAANCSGCHGTRGLSTEATGHAPTLNYDFYYFRPLMEFGYQPTSGFGLDLSDADLGVGDSTIEPTGHWQYVNTLQEWGISTAPGSNLDATRPTAGSFPTDIYPAPYLVTPGYPVYSTALFRQIARKTPLADSGFWARGAAGDAPPQWKSWMFKAKWGSKAWRDSLAAHSVTLKTILNSTTYENDASQMPPLATYIPDTAAIKILGEWAKTYLSSPVSVRASRSRIAQQLEAMPFIQNHLLIVPGEWTGKVLMISLSGQSYSLSSVGRGRYALPADAPMGVYLFRIGSRSFRTSLIR